MISTYIVPRRLRVEWVFRGEHSGGDLMMMMMTMMMVMMMVMVMVMMVIMVLVMMPRWR